MTTYHSPGDDQGTDEDLRPVRATNRVGGKENGTRAECAHRDDHYYTGLDFAD